jgi:uncharacterized membrane protein YqjE
MAMADERREVVRDRSTAELVKDLSQETSTLVRQEIALAKAEVSEKSKKAIPGIGMLVGAGIAALLMLGALTALLVIALDGAMALWAAALIVTALWALVAAGLYFAGRQQLKEMGSPVPQKTVETVKEDIEWLKHRKSSETR